MKSTKVLYSTLAASVLLTAGFATAAHADDATPASSTPETRTVASDASSTTEVSTASSVEASSSSTTVSSTSSSTSSTSSTSASAPASSSATSASSAATPKADDKFVEVPVAISLNNFEDSNRIRVSAAADITIPGNVYLEAKMTDVTTNQVAKKSGARLIQLSQTEPVTFGDLYIDSDYEEGHTYKIELSQSQDYVVDGKVYEFSSTKENAPTFTIKNGKVVLTNGPKLSIPTNSAKVKEIPVDVKVQTGTNGLYIYPTVSWETPVPGRARMNGILVNVKTGDIVPYRGTSADLSPTKRSDETEMYVGSDVKEGEVYRLHYSSMTDVIEEVNGVNYIYTGVSNPFTIKNGRVELVTETQPTTPSSQPTTPSTQPTTPSSQPTTPSTQPTTPSSQPTTPSTQPTTPSSQPTTPSTQPMTPSSQSTTPSSKPSNTGTSSSSSTENSAKKPEKGMKAGMDKPTSPTSSSQSTSNKGAETTSEVKSSSSQSAKVNPDTKGSETKSATRTNKKASLPNTGEKVSIFATAAGIVVAGLAIFTFRRKKD